MCAHPCAVRRGFQLCCLDPCPKGAQYARAWSGQQPGSDADPEELLVMSRHKDSPYQGQVGQKDPVSKAVVAVADGR